MRGHGDMTGERLMRGLDALVPLPALGYDACEKVSTRATSISMVRYCNNDYSVPVAYLPLSPSGGALLFHLLSKLYKRTSMVITTNLSFSEWASGAMPR